MNSSRQLDSNFLSKGTRQFRKKNTIFYNQGEVGEGVYWVEKGLITIKSCSIRGDVKNINIIGPNEFFGELSLIQAPSIATATAAEDTVVYYFNLEKLKSLFSELDAPIMILMNSVLVKMTELVKANFHSSAEQQIAYALIQLSQHSPERKIVMKQKDLAEHTGLTRVTLNTVFKKWKNSDIIHIENKVITIKDIAALEAYTRKNRL